MASSIAVSYFLAFALTLSFLSYVNSKNESPRNYASARVESCSGCSLKRLPDISQFIFHDIAKYNNVEFKHIQGAIPELIFFDEHDEEIERLVLSKLTREECNNLLLSKGFTKKKDEI